jgi:DNA-binding NtrC family response regulator
MLRSNARVICASNCSLRDRVRQGKFREDLYQRLNGLTLLIPSLRERLEDLPALIAAELKNASIKEGKTITAIHPAAMEKLVHYSWPGNLRELSHTVRTMVLFCEGGVILPDHVLFSPDLEPRGVASNNHEQSPPAPAAAPNHSGNGNVDLSLAGAVRRHVHFVYAQANRNQRQAAKLLGISRATLARHLHGPAKK